MSKTSLRDKNGLHSASSRAPRASARGSDAGRNAEIARLAYAKAEARGFIPGHEMDDWLEAEAEWRADAPDEPHDDPEAACGTDTATSRSPSHRR